MEHLKHFDYLVPMRMPPAGEIHLIAMKDGYQCGLGYNGVRILEVFGGAVSLCDQKVAAPDERGVMFLVDGVGADPECPACLEAQAAPELGAAAVLGEEMDTSAVSVGKQIRWLGARMFFEIARRLS